MRNASYRVEWRHRLPPPGRQPCGWLILAAAAAARRAAVEMLEVDPCCDVRIVIVSSDVDVASAHPDLGTLQSWRLSAAPLPLDADSRGRSAGMRLREDRAAGVRSIRKVLEWCIDRDLVDQKAAADAFSRLGSAISRRIP